MTPDREAECRYLLGDQSSQAATETFAFLDELRKERDELRGLCERLVSTKVGDRTCLVDKPAFDALYRAIRGEP